MTNIGDPIVVAGASFSGSAAGAKLLLGASVGFFGVLGLLLGAPQRGIGGGELVGRGIPGSLSDLQLSGRAADCPAGLGLAST